MAVLTPDARRFKAVALLSSTRFMTVTLVEAIGTEELLVARHLKPPDRTTGAQLATRIEAEVARLRAWQHSSLPRFYEHVEAESGHWLLWEYAEGYPASQWDGFQEQLSADWICTWLCDILDALAWLHGNGQSSGPFTPSDVLITPQRGAVLLSTNLVRRLFAEQAALFGQSLAGNEFMAPEVRSAAFSNPRSDLFSAGAVAWWLLTGYQRRETQPAEIRGRLHVLRPELQPLTLEVLSSILDPSPSTRTADAAAMVRLLRPELRDMRRVPPPLAPRPVVLRIVAPPTRTLGENVQAEKVSARRVAPLNPPADVASEDVPHVLVRARPLLISTLIVLIGLLLFWALSNTDRTVADDGTVGDVGSLQLISGAIETCAVDEFDTEHPRWQAGPPGEAPLSMRTRSGPVQLALGQGSSLRVRKNSIVQVQAWTAGEIQVRIKEGQIRVKLSAADHALVTFPDATTLRYDRNSSGTCGVLSGGYLIHIASGTAQLMVHGEPAELASNALFKLTPDGGRSPLKQLPESW